MESGERTEQARGFVPLWPFPHIQHHNPAKSVVLPWRIPKALPHYNITGALRQSNMAQMKEQIKTSGKKLSNEEIANLSEAEFKALVIKILTELIELGFKIKEEIKATQSEIKQNIQGTNSVGKKTGTQINDLEKRKK